MADYRPMPRGAYDANGRPIGRWPEPPEPVAPRQDLLPTPAPAPAPVQRTSPGGVGWLPNKQERDMMQDLYPESTQRPPTRLEKFFQWLSGSSDAGAAVNYDPNARGFALSDATIPTAAVTNTSTATPPVYVDFLRPDMQGLVQQEASRMTAQPELRRAYGGAADYVRGTAAPAAMRAYNGAVDFVASPILPADINTLGRQEFGRMTAQPELRRAYNGVVDYTSDNIVPAIEGYREPASDFVSRQVFGPVIGGVPSRAPGAPDIPQFRWGVEGRNTAGGLFRAPELDGLYDRAVDYTSGTIIPAARDAYDRAVDYTSGTIIPAARDAYDRTASFASSVQTPARAPGAPAVPAFNWTEEGARAAGDVFRAPELDGLYDRAVDYTSGTIIPAISRVADATPGWIDTAARAYGGETRAQAATLSLPGGRAPLPTAESYPDHFYVPGGRIGAPSVTAPPSVPVTTSPEIAVPYAGGTYYRNDSSGVPVLSNVPGGTYGIGFNSAPAYAMGTTLAAQRPDIYNPDGTPRQTTFGGQAVDPGLADTVATVSQITKDMQALNPRGGPPRIVGEEDPFDAAIRSVRSSGLSKNTQAKYIADITQQRATASQAAARDATSLAIARIGADSANARLAAEDKREADRLDLGRAKLAADVAGRGRVTTEEVPVVFGKIAGNPTPENKAGIIHTAVQGKYVGSGVTPEAASAALRANITSDINRYFDAAMSKPEERAKLEAEFGTSDEAKLREAYLLRAYRHRTTRQRTTQPTTGIGGTSSEE